MESVPRHIVVLQIYESLTLKRHELIVKVTLTTGEKLTNAARSRPRECSENSFV